jgi:hypothetical protein
VTGRRSSRSLSPAARKEGGEDKQDDENNTETAPTDGGEQKRGRGSGDFEARLAAMPVQPALPLRKAAKKRQKAIEDEDNDSSMDQEGGRASSHATSVISGWLRGVAESTGDEATAGDRDVV